jgi:hypothetical protein
VNRLELTISGDSGVVKVPRDPNCWKRLVDLTKFGEGVGRHGTLVFCATIHLARRVVQYSFTGLKPVFLGRQFSSERSLGFWP